MTVGRAQTGISGLDTLLEGGLPVARNYIISGSAGAGKTIRAVSSAKWHPEYQTSVGRGKNGHKLALIF